MLQLLLKTHLAFLLIPLFTLAIEPNNPVTFCDRFLGDDDKSACVAKTEKNKSDWYASSACSLLEDDKNFLVCLDEIKDANYNPEALELCAQGREIPDDQRLNCVKKIKNKDYTRAEIKKCSERTDVGQIAECLSLSAKARKPASKTAPAGFQSLQLHH